MYKGFKSLIARPVGSPTLDKFQQDVVATLKAFVLTDYSKAEHGLVPAPLTDAGSQILFDNGWALLPASTITVRKNSGANVGTRGRLNLIEGTGITLTVADDGVDNEVDITVTATAVGLTDGDKGDITVAGVGTTWTIDNDTVTDAKLRNSAALSVIGRSVNSVGDPADIVASADGDVLRRSGVTLGFGSIPESSVTSLTADLAARVLSTRTINTTAPLAGGGDLSADRTLTIGYDAVSIELSGANLRRAALTGDVTAAAGSNATTIANDAVTYAKLQNVAGTSVIGKSGAGAGDAVDITAAADGDVLRRSGGNVAFGSIPEASVTNLTTDLAAKVDSTRTISTTSPLAGGGDLSANRTLTINYDATSIELSGGSLRRAALTGDVTAAAGSNATTIANDAVTYAKLQNVAGTSVVGKAGAGTGDAADITAASDGDVLRRSGGNVAFGAIPESSVTNLTTDLAAKVDTTRTISTTSPLSGGGDLSANRTLTISDQRPSVIQMPYGFITSTASGTLTPGSTTCPAWYMGVAQKDFTSAKIRLLVTVGLSGITWAEVFVATGALTMGSNPSLTRAGYTDVSATFNSASTTVPKNTTVSVNITAGTEWWIGFAKLSTGSATFRAGTIGDQLICGYLVDGGNIRPSTFGAATTFTIAASSVVCPWATVQIS